MDSPIEEDNEKWVIVYSPKEWKEVHRIMELFRKNFEESLEKDPLYYTKRWILEKESNFTL